MLTGRTTDWNANADNQLIHSSIRTASTGLYVQSSASTSRRRRRPNQRSNPQIGQACASVVPQFLFFHIEKMAAPKLNKIFSDQIPALSEKEEDLLHQVKNVRTTPRDNRFPSTNQALHCWNRYNEWLLCLKETGKDEDKCQVYRQYAVSICPTSWTENWDEARDEGTFAGLKV